MCLALFAEFSITSDVVLSKWKKGNFPSSCMTMNVITKSAIFKTHFMHVPDPLMVAIHYASPKCKYNDRSAADERQIYNLLGVEWLPELQLDLFHGAPKRKKEACRQGHLSALIDKHPSDTGSVNNGLDSTGPNSCLATSIDEGCERGPLGHGPQLNALREYKSAINVRAHC